MTFLWSQLQLYVSCTHHIHISHIHLCTKLTIEHSITCDSRINLNYIYISYIQRITMCPHIIYISYIYTQRITMCPHGYHHSGSRASPALIYIRYEGGPHSESTGIDNCYYPHQYTIVLAIIILALSWC